MKHIIKNWLQFSFAAFLCALSFNSTAQTTKPLSKLYLQAGAGAGTYKSGDFNYGLRAVINHKWSMSLSYRGLEMDPKNLPKDYQPETGYVLFIPYTYQVTTDMSMISLSAGRYFTLGKNFWATTEAGLSYVNGEKVNFTRAQQVSTNVLFAVSTTSNYKSTKENKSTIGALLGADVNWAFASFMGLGAGVYANVNAIQSPIGFDIKLLVGKTGRVKKQRRANR